MDVTSQLAPVSAVLILDAQSGKSVVTRYYHPLSKFASEKTKAEFETAVYGKLRRYAAAQGTSVVFTDRALAVFHVSNDVMVTVVGPSAESELLLGDVLDTIIETLSNVLESQLEISLIQENMNLVFVVLDEVIHHGRVLTDSPAVLAPHLAPAFSPSAATNIGDQTISQAIESAKQSMAKTLMQELFGR